MMWSYGMWWGGLWPGMANDTTMIRPTFRAVACTSGGHMMSCYSANSCHTNLGAVAALTSAGRSQTWLAIDELLTQTPQKPDQQRGLS